MNGWGGGTGCGRYLVLVFKRICNQVLEILWDSPGKTIFSVRECSAGFWQFLCPGRMFWDVTNIYWEAFQVRRLRRPSVWFSGGLLHHGFTAPEGATTLFKGGWLGHIHTYPVEMAQNFWTAIIAFSVSTLLTVVLSLVTKQKKSIAELTGLVYSLTPHEVDKDLPWHKRPAGLAIIVGVICIILSIISW